MIMIMLRLYGIPISDDAARRLAATLVADGGVHALSAAAMITKGVDGDLYTVALTAEERSAILAMLEEADEPLAELRGKLLEDHMRRLSR